MTADDLFNRAAQLVEGVAAATAWAEVMLALGLFFALCAWFVIIGTKRD